MMNLSSASISMEVNISYQTSVVTKNLNFKKVPRKRTVVHLFLTIQYFHSKTVMIHISWFLVSSADHDPHCFISLNESILIMKLR